MAWLNVCLSLGSSNSSPLHTHSYRVIHLENCRQTYGYINDFLFCFGLMDKNYIIQSKGKTINSPEFFSFGNTSQPSPLSSSEASAASRPAITTSLGITSFGDSEWILDSGQMYICAIVALGTAANCDE